MRTSDKERREVAARLRNDVGESECIDYAVFRIIHDVLDIKNATGAKAAHALADLIDRPTCQMKSIPKSNYRVCTRCGAFVRKDSATNCTEVIPVRFCPNCEAMVTEKEEDDG